MEPLKQILDLIVPDLDHLPPKPADGRNRDCDVLGKNRQFRVTLRMVAFRMACFVELSQ